MKAQYDVAVVGASIAGCSAATLLGRRGLSVALIERKTDPSAYKNICTHFIQPSAVPVIERLGVAEDIEAAGGVRGGIEMFTRWGWIRDTTEKDDGYPSRGYSIRRQTLDPMLRRLAADTTGVELMLGHSVRALSVDDGRITGIEVEDRNKEQREIKARLVVGADGRDSHLAKLANLPEKTKPHGRFAYFAHYRDLPLAAAGNSQMWMLEPDVAYAFPNDDGVTVLACMPAREKLSSFKEDIEGNFERFFAELPLAPPVASARRVSKVMGKIDMTNVSREPVGPGLALIGDAAIAADPLWGVGCGWAFQSADWLADCAADALLTGGDLDRALTRYRKKHHAALAGHHSLISDFSSGRAYNPIERLMFSAAARDPEMAHHFYLFGSRNIGVRQFLAPGPLARALWVNARRRRIPAPEREDRVAA